jgi:DNA invertase Pin-like site-specific DNA recombinase
MSHRPAKRVRCAIYTRVSTEYGLEQDFNSLDAQHDAAAAYVRSQAQEGWTLIRARYDDGGYSGGSTDRPALQQLLADIGARKIDVVVVYKVDRLTRSLADFAKLVELFDAHGVSFVSVTQQFNTTTSMGRLTLNVLLSFAQFEREVTGERIRDKIGASKRHTRFRSPKSVSHCLVKATPETRLAFDRDRLRATSMASHFAAWRLSVKSKLTHERWQMSMPSRENPFGYGEARTTSG